MVRNSFWRNFRYICNCKEVTCSGLNTLLSKIYKTGSSHRQPGIQRPPVNGVELLTGAQPCSRAVQQATIEERGPSEHYVYNAESGMLKLLSLLSRVTPSVLTVSENGTAVPARSMLESKGKERRRYHEPNKIASTLSGFMAKPLKQNHAYMDERHSSSFSLPD